jgi:uncharacterized protein DUF3526
VKREAFNDLAGASPARHQHFRAQVEEFSPEWRAHFAPFIFQGREFRSADYDRLPALCLSRRGAAKRRRAQDIWLDRIAGSHAADWLAGRARLPAVSGATLMKLLKIQARRSFGEARPTISLVSARQVFHTIDITSSFAPV